MRRLHLLHKTFEVGHLFNLRKFSINEKSSKEADMSTINYTLLVYGELWHLHVASTRNSTQSTTQNKPSIFRCKTRHKA
jgi:hypothetical protein